MKTRFMKIFILVFIGCFVITAYAVAGGFTGYHFISQVRQRECVQNKGAEITLATVHNNPDGCANNQIIELDCGLATYKANLAIILSAFSAGQEMQAWVSGCDAEGQAILKSVSVRE